MLRLYCRLIGARIRAQMQYRWSFALELAGFALTTGFEFGIIAILFQRFPSVAGWSIAEVALLYGLSSIAFGLAEMAGRGFDAPFEVMMQRGAFDTILIRPLGTFFQVLASEFQVRRLGRMAQGAAVLAYALSRLPIVWTLPRLILLLLTIGAGAIIYLAIMVIGATICFWTIKTPEVINAFTFGGQELTSYPLSIYNRWVRGIFLLIVPVAFVNYPTALLLLGRTDPYGLPAALAWAAPLVALVFGGVAWGFWQLGVRKYASAGS